MDTTQNLTVQQFGATIKAKYPSYADKSDEEVGNAMLQKYPQYNSRIIQSNASSSNTSDSIIGSGLKAGLTAAKNVIPSAYNFVKGIIKSPLDTAKNLVQIPQEAASLIKEQGVDSSVKNFLTSLPESTYKTLIPQSVRQLVGGDVAGASQTLQNDPFGQIAPLVLGAKGLAEKGGFSSQFDKGIETIAKPVTTAAGIASDVAKGVVNKVVTPSVKFGLSQATGLDPQTIQKISSNPSDFSKNNVDNTNRVSVADDVKSAIDQRLTHLSDTGKGYQNIKDSTGNVNVPENSVKNIIENKGYKVLETLNDDGTKNYKVKVTSESPNLTSADKTQLEDFLNVYGNEPNLSPNAFLNARSALSGLSKYDSAKSGNLQPIARELRSHYDSLGKDQIPGLAELDKQYAPEVTLLKQIKKDYIDSSTGDFKQGAVNKIANLTGVGKEAILSRLEEIKPGIAHRVQLLKAVEDIQKSSGLKVGTYARAGSLVGGIGTGNIPLIVGSILSQPEIAVQLIRGFGLTKPQILTVSRLVQNAANDVNNFKVPEIPSNQQQKVN